MNLRTIKFWAIYDPEQKHLVTTRLTKKELVKRAHMPHGCVLVKMVGHYLPPRRRVGGSTPPLKGNKP